MEKHIFMDVMVVSVLFCMITVTSCEPEHQMEYEEITVLEQPDTVTYSLHSDYWTMEEDWNSEKVMVSNFGIYFHVSVPDFLDSTSLIFKFDFDEMFRPSDPEYILPEREYGCKLSDECVIAIGNKSPHLYADSGTVTVSIGDDGLYTIEAYFFAMNCVHYHFLYKGPIYFKALN